MGTLLALVCATAGAQGAATWIWYPGDFEIWLSNRMQVQCVERDVAWPPFWRLYSHQPQVTTRATWNWPSRKTSAGRHDINIQVYNPAVRAGARTGQDVYRRTRGRALNQARGSIANAGIRTFSRAASRNLSEVSSASWIVTSMSR
jgi:hypothetical protein